MLSAALFVLSPQTTLISKPLFVLSPQTTLQLIAEPQSASKPSVPPAPQTTFVLLPHTTFFFSASTIIDGPQITSLPQIGLEFHTAIDELFT